MPSVISGHTNQTRKLFRRLPTRPVPGPTATPGFGPIGGSGGVAAMVLLGRGRRSYRTAGNRPRTRILPTPRFSAPRDARVLDEPARLRADPGRVRRSAVSWRYAGCETRGSGAQ